MYLHLERIPLLLLFASQLSAVGASPHPHIETEEGPIITGGHGVGQPEFITPHQRIRSVEGVAEESHLEARDLTADQSQALYLHNVARAKFGVQALLWDDTLYQAALTYAKQMAVTNVFAHSLASTRKGQGENLAYNTSTATITNPITKATAAWLAEIVYYHNETIPNGAFNQYGHYTQCTWNTTIKVGVATAYNGLGTWYTVARYAPAGNIVGLRPY